MTGQAALVTGAARGIGFATAKCLAREGFSVAINDIGSETDLADRVAEIRAEGVDCVAAPFDVTDRDAYGPALARVEDAIGPLTTLVNNAGVGVLQRGDPLDVTEDSWNRCHEVNAKAVFFLTQTFARRLVERQRDPGLFYSIINVTSANAVAVALQRAEYCASKAAAAMVSKLFAARLGRDNISVYDVQPGLIDTEMTSPVIDQYIQRAAEGLTLLPRVGQPSDVGRIIASLASGMVPYTTGQVISADAGMLVPRF